MFQGFNRMRNTRTNKYCFATTRFRLSAAGARAYRETQNTQDMALLWQERFVALQDRWESISRSTKAPSFTLQFIDCMVSVMTAFNPMSVVLPTMLKPELPALRQPEIDLLKYILGIRSAASRATTPNAAVGESALDLAAGVANISNPKATSLNIDFPELNLTGYDWEMYKIWTKAFAGLYYFDLTTDLDRKIYSIIAAEGIDIELTDLLQCWPFNSGIVDYKKDFKDAIQRRKPYDACEDFGSSFIFNTLCKDLRLGLPTSRFAVINAAMPVISISSGSSGCTASPVSSALRIVARDRSSLDSADSADLAGGPMDIRFKGCSIQVTVFVTFVFLKVNQEDATYFPARTESCLESLNTGHQKLSLKDTNRKRTHKRKRVSGQRFLLGYYLGTIMLVFITKIPLVSSEQPAVYRTSTLKKLKENHFGSVILKGHI
ncbi:hypothetical protein GGR51DRAFT_569729 [Nemania sp. FL0031]|nr:hypothetical protein GGR51DRAFT_569729 [Nemania sp. FL0031]